MSINIELEDILLTGALSISWIPMYYISLGVDKGMQKLKENYFKKYEEKNFQRINPI